VAEVLPGCDWSTAANGEMTAQVVHSAGGAASSVTFTGSVQVQCTVSGSSSPVTSTVTLTGSGAQSSGGLYP
jgi:carbon monoxide dehydrogenase subunit G